MIDLETVEREISELEAREASYKLCERLAWLYVVRDHIKPGNEQRTTDYLQGSEFLELASGVDYRKLMEVLNEHVESIKMLFPKSYDYLIERIRELR